MHDLLHLPVRQIQRGLGPVVRLEEAKAVLVPTDRADREAQPFAQAVMPATIADQLARVDQGLEVLGQLRLRRGFDTDSGSQIRERQGLSGSLQRGQQFVVGEPG